MTMHFADIARDAARDGGISAEDILALRQAGWADGRMSREEAEAIFAAQRATRDPSRAWSDFFVEAIRQHVLEGSEPRGYASEEEADWLIAQVEKNGEVCSMTELELLVDVTERAQDVPGALKDYILDVLEEAVLTGSGPTRDGGALSSTHVTKAECALMRRTIFGPASERPAAVSQKEAELLFRIKDATEHGDNAPGFKDLFVQGVANYLMGFASENAQMSPERQRELNAFIADNKASVGGFLGAMAASAPDVLGAIFGRRESGPDREASAIEDGKVTGIEKAWLNAQIEASGKVDEYDRALLDFLSKDLSAA